MTDNLIEALPFSIYWKDTSHRFLGCNARYLADIGLLDKKLLINRTSAQLPKHAKDIYCNMDVEKLIIQKKTPRLQLTRSIISSSQRTIYIKETLQIINDSEGKLSGILCCYEEICELEHKFMQDHRLTEYSPQSTNLDYVTSLAANLAHDFNNALAVISGYSQLMLRNSQLVIHKEKFTDYLNRISMATDKISMLTEKLLHFSRDYIPQLERLELYNYIRKNLINYSSTIGVDINVPLNKNDKFWVMADVKQIDEVVRNLLSNAKDAINDEFITQTVSDLLRKEHDVPNTKIKVTSQDGIVKLIGFVDTSLQANRVIELASSVQNVIDVNIEKLEVKSSKEFLSDAFITAKAKGKIKYLSINNKISPGYELHIETTNKVVHILGDVKNEKYIKSSQFCT